MKRVCIFLLPIFLLVPFAICQKIERLPAFAGEASEKVKAALDSSGYRVFLPNTLQACDVWLAKDVPLTKRAEAKGAIYPEFVDSQFLGVITFPKGGGRDFRGQTVRAGSYTMRYQLLPSDGNHLGVAPNPDMVLLVPIADDVDPKVNFDFGKLIELSMGAAHSAHPAVLEMMPPEGAEPSATQTDDGWIVLHGPILDKDGKRVPVALVVKGSAAQ